MEPRHIRLGIFDKLGRAKLLEKKEGEKMKEKDMLISSFYILRFIPNTKSIFNILVQPNNTKFYLLFADCICFEI